MVKSFLVILDMAGKLIGVAAVIVNGKEMSFYEWRKTGKI